MRYALALLLVVTLACGDSNGPKGLDPTVLFNNFTPGAPNVGGTVTMVWYDQSGQVLKTDIPFSESRCIQFIATRLADSVRFEMYAGDTTSTSSPWWKAWSPWFNPQTGFVNAAPGAYPNGAEYWIIDFSKTTWISNPDKAPC